MDKTLIQITNFKEHPEDRTYTVFMFRNREMGLYFEELLGERGISFEKDDDIDHVPARLLYAVKRTHLESAIELNYTAHGKFRRPSLDYPILRWGLLIFMGALIALCLYAYYTS